MADPLLVTPQRIKVVILKTSVVVAPTHQDAASRAATTDPHLWNAGRYDAAWRAGLLMLESTKVERVRLRNAR